MIENFVSTLPNIFDVRFQVSDVAGIFAHFALHCVVQLIPTFQRFLGAPLDAQSSVFLPGHFFQCPVYCSTAVYMADLY